MNQPSPPASPGGLFINNTPVKTGVLWGCRWSGGWPEWLRAGAPAVDDLQQVEDIDHAVGVGIALARRYAVIA